MPANLSKLAGWSFLFLRSLCWTVLVPGAVTIYIPYLIVTRWSPPAAADRPLARPAAGLYR